MHNLLLALALTTLLSRPVTSPEETAVMLPVRQFVDAFNKGDAKAVVAVCSDITSILDEFPPYEWHGAGTCATWLGAYDADAKKNGITDGVVTLGIPRHVDISSDRAYVVVPADYVYKEKGKSVREMKSTIVITLRKTAIGWRMNAWAWGKH